MFILLSAAMLALGLRSRRQCRFSLNGYELSLGISGASGFYFVMEVIVGEAYRVFGPSLRDGGHNRVVVDCGANVGFFALWALRQNPGLTVHALEPHPVTYLSLCEHVRINELAERIHPCQCAVGARDGTIDIDVCSDSNMAVIGDVLDQGGIVRGQRVQVPLVTIDSYCAERNIRPALLKIDVEGYEVDVLQGAREVMPAVAGVILEAHSPQLTQACTRIMESYGFVVTAVDGLLLAQRPAGWARTGTTALSAELRAV